MIRFDLLNAIVTSQSASFVGSLVFNNKIRMISRVFSNSTLFENGCQCVFVCRALLYHTQHILYAFASLVLDIFDLYANSRASADKPPTFWC